MGYVITPLSCFYLCMRICLDDISDMDSYIFVLVSPIAIFKFILFSAICAGITLRHICSVSRNFLVNVARISHLRKMTFVEPTAHLEPCPLGELSEEKRGPPHPLGWRN